MLIFLAAADPFVSTMNISASPHHDRKIDAGDCHQRNLWCNAGAVFCGLNTPPPYLSRFLYGGHQPNIVGRRPGRRYPATYTRTVS
jgi:hypothetical protein